MGLWLPVEGNARLLVPYLELENALDVPGVRVTTYDEFPGDVPPVLWMLGESGAGRLAVDRLDAGLLDAARAAVSQLDLTDHVRAERVVKHPEELALIREAARFADLALERLLSSGADIIRQGGTELDLMADCTGHARAALTAVHGTAFQGTKSGITASVHSGPRAALPHGTVLARRPQAGEPIIAGIGCSLGGGIRHRIGHGMGVEGHEAPWLAPGDATLVAAGMVFSCEPGVYRPGFDGWRTIETLIVGAGRVETASRFQSLHPIDTRVLAI